MILLTLLLEFGLGPLLYTFYQKDVVLEEGAPGTAAGAEIPVAQSISDMKDMGTFTLIIKGVVIKHDTVRSGDRIYHRIQLPSGEKVIAHINRNAIVETDEAGVYRMPAGVWREWTPPEEIMIFDDLLTTTGHYVDMYGDYVPVLTESDYSQRFGRAASAWVYMIGILLYRIIGVRRWYFAPAFFWKRDPLLPRNDLECWCASAFAIWAHSFAMLEGWPLITGAHGSRKVRNSFRNTALKEQWEIQNRQDGLATVHELTQKHAGRLNTAYAGWDLCRAVQLLGIMYLVKMIDREELDREFSRVGKVLQQSFHSWDEMAESYLEGYQAWLERCGEKKAAQYTARRKSIFEMLKSNPDGPYSVPWNTDLTWTPGMGRGERQVVRRVLSRYRP